MRKAFFWLHKWLGLVTGVIVVIVSLTGCIYVFAEELKAHFYRDRLFIEAQIGQTMPLSALRDKAQQALGSEYKISRADLYPAAGRSWIFRASKTNEKAIGHWNYYEYYYRVYINPYNGRVLHIEDSKNAFFQLMLSLHMNLLLGKYIGSPVVGYSVALFVLTLITGLVLWWPKAWTKKKIRSGLRVKWNASRKRLIYDIHNVLGFYMWIPMFIIAVTGLVYSFKWVDSSIQFLFDGAAPTEERVIPKSSPGVKPIDADKALDQALEYVLQVNPTADMLSIRFRSDKSVPIDIQTRLEKSKTSAFVWYYFDRKTGDLLLHYGDKDVRGGEKIRTLNYDLHVGSIGGIGTKILAFIASLIAASLPVTGFLMWYHKNKKQVKKKRKRTRTFAEQ